MILISFSVIATMCTISGSLDKKTPKRQLSELEIKERNRTEQIQSGFSSWDGSHRKLEEQIQSSMEDPDSYEHVKTVYADEGEYLIVKTQFRGRNAFGGVVTNTVTAMCTLDGQGVVIIDWVD